MKLFQSLKEIPITALPGLRIGNAQNYEAMTGVTVLLFDQGAKVGVDISGGGPASRETPLASPLTIPRRKSPPRATSPASICRPSPNPSPPLLPDSRD